MLFNKTLCLTGLGFVSLKLGICRFPLSLSSSNVCNISHWTALSYWNLILTNLYGIRMKRKIYANLFYIYFCQNGANHRDSSIKLGARRKVRSTPIKSSSKVGRRAPNS